MEAKINTNGGYVEDGHALKKHMQEMDIPMFIAKKKTPVFGLAKILFPFCKKYFKYEKTGLINSVLVYKKIQGRIYIIHNYILPPNHWRCRCIF